VCDEEKKKEKKDKKKKAKDSSEEDSDEWDDIYCFSWIKLTKHYNITNHHLFILLIKSISKMYTKLDINSYMPNPLLY